MIDLTLAHLSDLHFGHITSSLTQFLSKRWIGNLNLFLFRKRAYATGHLLLLPSLLKTLKVEGICITGDLTSTSLDEEFALARGLINQFSSPCFVIPGNHDCYTKESERTQVFYDFFPSQRGVLDICLRDDKVLCTKIKEGWWWIGLDCAVATPPFNAYGVFTADMEGKLENILRSLPERDGVIIGNHFPLFSSTRPSHELKNGERLRTLLKRWPSVKMYLHGHDHKPYLIDRRKEGFPLVLNSGCSAVADNGSFYLIEIKDSQLHLDHYFYREGLGWRPEKTHTFFISSSTLSATTE